MAEWRTRLPSQHRLLAIFRYERKTGKLFWRYRPECRACWNTRFAGKVAGMTKIGVAVRVIIDGQPFVAHRIIFKMVYGFVPHLIDHRDRNKTNNRLRNLRAANKSRNGANSSDQKRTLPRGVFLCPTSKPNPYRAQINSTHLGVFPTVAEASAAFKRAAKRAYGEFANA